MVFPRILRATRPLHSNGYILPHIAFITRRFLFVDPSDGTCSSSMCNSTISEQFVLKELSDLLPIDLDPPKPRLFTERPMQECALTSLRDQILSPAERLRGVFLQKLPGRSALESALSAISVDLTHDIYSDVLNKGNLGGAAMVSFFSWAIQQPKVVPCTKTYNVMLRALGRRKFFDFVDEILLRMKDDDVKVNAETLEILMDSYVRARRVLKAVELFKNLAEIGAERNVESLNILLKCLFRRSHFKVANSLFHTTKGEISFDCTTYNEMIGGWAKFGRVDKVESYWMMMTADGFSPNSVTYKHIIEAFGRAGRIDEAVDIFKKMKEKDCPQDTISYNAMISNFIALGELDKGIEYYRGMIEKECSPNIDTYSILICALLKVRRVADALEIFDEMVCCGILPSTGMITSIIEPLCSFGPPHAAMVIYNKCRKAGCKLSLRTYKLLLMRLSRFGKVGMVLKIWKEMQDNGYDSDKEVYEYIVNGLCNVGQVDNAVLVVEESLRRGFCLPRTIYSKLNGKLLQMNKVERAYRLFLKVKVARKNANSRSYWRANGWHF
ncbi:putative pentatricopeptide repeat-containing protein At5g43820 [Zingiber officinale]|uniref:Pentatricopeptide repeat-containing protein n=1 Tax=Zingiber officinale TaxID=94328 RepID=A0A8J5C6I1_ZINOF|nr:putative pentatricopeptide repeat-containing protein At5g43820 [Zingiber officinale]XP_042449233.1 putative pentatricopeptide repeat-containing protein At5g43820 [Zingiber officinale]XP_042449234.1 putative pentatricopeptide repeat-containing protein At5g43820 [Zingiber officinale]KAG6468140.1 hypothetical protein ZIOFF_072709 [Zingiber officinale]